MKKIPFFLLIFLFSFIFPTAAFGDGGMVVWPPPIHLDQSAQNAIVGWNGTQEIIILSVDIESSDNATILRVIPLPANPSDIEEGSFESFEKIVEIINEKIMVVRPDYMGLGAGKEGLEAQVGVEITFHEKIGAHDITVVKVNDLDCFLDWIKDFVDEHGLEQKEISSEFEKGVASYLKREIDHFVFDVIDAGQEKESIKPIIYQFESDYLYYPILISGISDISDSYTQIDLFLVTEKDFEFPSIPYSYQRHWFSDYGYLVEFTDEELNEVSDELANLFSGVAMVRKASIYGRLKELRRDLMLFPSHLWDENLGLKSKGEAVKVLQKILINEDLWEAKVGATGYFGPVTKTALEKFQEKYKDEILEPIQLKKGTGFLGPKTRDYLDKLSLKAKVKIKAIALSRNLRLGMKGEDVKVLQEALIKEGVWSRPTVRATGYFGPITNEAVKRYQEKYSSEILQPLKLEKGTGFVGPSTRAYLEKQAK